MWIGDESHKSEIRRSNWRYVMWVGDESHKSETRRSNWRYVVLEILHVNWRSCTVCHIVLLGFLYLRFVNLTSSSVG